MATRPAQPSFQVQPHGGAVNNAQTRFSEQLRNRAISRSAAMRRRFGRKSTHPGTATGKAAFLARFAAAAALFCATCSADAAPLTVYDGALENAFANYYSWAAIYNFADASVVRGGEQ